MAVGDRRHAAISMELEFVSEDVAEKAAEKEEQEGGKSTLSGLHCS
jgi:hypothetical protein